MRSWIFGRSGSLDSLGGEEASEHWRNGKLSESERTVRTCGKSRRVLRSAVAAVVDAEYGDHELVYGCALNWGGNA